MHSMDGGGFYFFFSLFPPFKWPPCLLCLCERFIPHDPNRAIGIFAKHFGLLSLSVLFFRFLFLISTHPEVIKGRPIRIPSTSAMRTVKDASSLLRAQQQQAQCRFNSSDGPPRICRVISSATVKALLWYFDCTNELKVASQLLGDGRPSMNQQPYHIMVF